MSNHKELLVDILKRDKKGDVIIRESSKIEFKESFNFLNMAEYSKCMASFANRAGGYIIFGVKDNPRVILGVDYNKFNEISQEKITSFLLEYFNPEIKWDIGCIDYNGKAIGYIYTYEAENKPVICKKNKDNIIKNGEIYYRYRGQTKNIEYGELIKIIEEIREKEKQNWIKLFKDIARIGPENAIVNKKSEIEIRPSSSPKALPVNIKEEDIKKFYPYDYKQLTNKLKNRYMDFKEDQKYHSLRKEFKKQREFCFTKRLDPDNPKSPKKDFYSEEVIKEFDKYYTLKKL